MGAANLGGAAESRLEALDIRGAKRRDFFFALLRGWFKRFFHPKGVLNTKNTKENVKTTDKGGDSPNRSHRNTTEFNLFSEKDRC